ncbi:LysM peptidoglycan-binding domain-containing protein [Paenibacillus nicotianae]|uniref:LysM peptidoglycan-binding domain-containing protein n=1 Tax=Paenibacillus nicotianae TaxID=1526551 RepID=A0ABW4USN8_9BACL
MNSTFKKVLLSTALATSLGAVALVAPMGASQVSAAADTSNHQKAKDKAEQRADNLAYQTAVSQQVEAMFGTAKTTPAQETTPAVTPTTNTTTVVVPQGASLTEIAAQYGVTVDELIAANNLLPAGYQLTIPQK